MSRKRNLTNMNILFLFITSLTNINLNVDSQHETASNIIAVSRRNQSYPSQTNNAGDNVRHIEREMRFHTSLDIVGQKPFSTNCGSQWPKGSYLVQASVRLTGRRLPCSSQTGTAEVASVRVKRGTFGQRWLATCRIFKIKFNYANLRTDTWARRSEGGRTSQRETHAIL